MDPDGIYNNFIDQVGKVADAPLPKTAINVSVSYGSSCFGIWV